MAEHFIEEIDSKIEELEEIISIYPGSSPHADCENEVYTLSPESELIIEFDSDNIRFENNDLYQYGLRVIGEIDIPPMDRCETRFPVLYRKIDDVLHLDQEGNYLQIDCSNENYERGFYYKLDCSNIDPGQFTIGIEVKGDSLEYNEGTVLELTAELYYTSSAKRHYYESCDVLHNINLKETIEKEYKLFSSVITAERDVDFIMLHFQIIRLTGQLTLKAPFILDKNQKKLTPDFYTSTIDDSICEWMGDCLSQKEWPAFQITLNEKVVFRGRKFHPIYRFPAFEIPLEKSDFQEGQNFLAVKLLDSYQNTLNFHFKNAEILKRKRGLCILSYPRYVELGKPFAIMAHSDKEYDTIVVSVGKSAIQYLNNGKTTFLTGLNFLNFIATVPDADISITVKCGEWEQTVTIRRVVSNDGLTVLTGTGDSVYINQNEQDYMNHLIWYMSNQIGNMITFRPVYRWSGSYVSERTLWGRIVNFCQNLSLKYVHMIDGRELNGCNANPEKEWFDSKLFLGNQCHEKDGSYYYWGATPVTPAEELFLTVFSKKMKWFGINPPKTPVYSKKGVMKYIDPEFAEDMKSGADYFMHNASEMIGRVDRHTGPSVLFKYFYKSGADWLGAELMYGSHEIISASLRGSSKAYGKKSFGAHLAVQWSTTPHDTEQRFRRYLIALFECYMHGYDQINTEEGLWRLEELYAEFERFSFACVAHKKVQQFFYQFVQTHPRRGEQYVPLGVLHGRYDAWICFTRPNAWMQSGEAFLFSDMEASWDLLKLFYPQAVLDALYIHNAPNEPLGFYSKSEFGAIDILPVEAETAVYHQYKFLFFLGYNTLDDETIKKLYEYAEQGGEVLIGLCHLYQSFRREELLSDTSSICCNKTLERFLGVSELSSVVLKTDGKTAFKTCDCKLVTAEVLERRGDSPVVLRNAVGRGSVTFINLAGFPASGTVRPLYEKYLMKLTQRAIEREYPSGWIVPEGYVTFTTYRNLNAKIFYLLNINWWETDNRQEQAVFYWENLRLPLQVDHNYMGILTVMNETAIYTNDRETDVIRIEEGEKTQILIQGAGTASITLFFKDTNQIKAAEISGSCIESVFLMPDRIILKVKLQGVADIFVSRGE